MRVGVLSFKSVSRTHSYEHQLAGSCFINVMFINLYKLLCHFIFKLTIDLIILAGSLCIVFCVGWCMQAIPRIASFRY